MPTQTPPAENSEISLTADLLAWIDNATDEEIRTQYPRVRAMIEAAFPPSTEALPWCEWLAKHFPAVCTAPFSPRHVRLWEWFEALTPGERPAPQIEVWPRGGAKSTSAELGVARLAVKLTRRYVLYVSETQDQADKHVQSIATLLETLGVERAVGAYGHSKGWRRQELRTADGFNVSAYGLDTAARGVKLDQYRPDTIILDDIDSQDDTTRTVDKKIAAVTTSIIPAGSPDCAILGIQNLVHEEGIFSQLADGRADFLHDRVPAFVEPAIVGLKYEAKDRGDGLKSYFIIEGVATWEGQNRATCEKQINAWGIGAFLREAQHEVEGAAGYFFDVKALNYIDADDPQLADVVRWCRAWDLAATEGGGDWTCGYLMGMTGKYPDVKVFITDGRRGQWASDNVKARILAVAEDDGTRPVVRLPQDPAQAGKSQADQYKKDFRANRPRHRLVLVPTSGAKSVRARGFAEAVNKGNVYVVRDRTQKPTTNTDAYLASGAIKPVHALTPWNFAMKECLRKFREDVEDQQDDDVDALSDAFNQLAEGRSGTYKAPVVAGQSRPTF